MKFSEKEILETQSEEVRPSFTFNIILFDN